MTVKVVAEIGWNFMGDLDLAEKMISSAAESGANICKFQYWNPENLKEGPWDHDGRRKIYEAAKLDQNKIKILSDMCSASSVEFLVSVFSVKDAQFIYQQGFKSLKIPSHESYNVNLYEFCLQNFQRVFASIGACSENELDEFSLLYGKYKDQCDISPMHCVSAYPCDESRLNLPRVTALRERFGTTGLSDHSQSLLSGGLSVGLGAQVIEKHFTTDKTLPGRDNKFALDPAELKIYIDNIRSAELMMLDHGLSSQDIESDIINNYRGRWTKK